MATGHGRAAAITRRGAIGGALAGVAMSAVPARALASRPILFRRADHVLPIASPPLPAADVLVRDGAIVALGRDLDVADADVVDARGAILMPGLVDTHWHMWATLARGLSSSARGGFVPTMAALSPLFTPQDNALGVRLSLAEAVNAGITTVHNWAHNIRSPAHAEAELTAMARAGLRGRMAYGYPQDLPRDRTMDLAHLAMMAKHMPAGLVSLGICARGPDRSDDRVWQAEWDAARSLGMPISTHMASDRKAAALGGVAKLAARGGLGPDVQLVHLTGASPADLGRVAGAGSPVSISPWTELEVGYGLTPVAAMMAAGLTMGLSVDNLSLAGNADMFGVMRITADLAAGMAMRQGAVDDATVLRWATLDGARSLGLDHAIGSIAPGKRADLILVRTDAVNTSPHADPASLLTHAAQPANVSLVMIDGTIHKRDGALARTDLPDLRDRAQQAIARIRREAGLDRRSPAGQDSPAR